MRSDPTVPAIDVRELSKSFGAVQVLRDIDLTVTVGQKICLVGPSGSGKSTLLRCLNFLEEPDHGVIRLFGEPLGFVETNNGKRKRLTERDINRVRTSIGMVFQHFNLWNHFTALENIIEAPMGVKGIPRKVAQERAMELLSRIGLSSKKDSYPSQLSGGQQQRVAIARALAMEPRIMLFDEPTSALDPELVNEVLVVMRGLANDGMTMLVVTHEMGFAVDVADRVLFMCDGEILEDGPPSTVLLKPSTERATQFLSAVSRRGTRE
ncbi:amino acid ABC transporter ATP-binding protein [Mesorhizobium sp.]|uniref:amino acid ABC transporter ATP-binding protein n=1 Tax=Mesorhizobium sp. TaxID=1871066 RepID=UPI000FEAA7E7|nr:amino acid ABC transporter ATP-binding protein [Mesorhizobium sp.]RWI87900.1 MAG: amino acid ABC transporter ATP-binding protein [Mesorhizobium sp.]